MEVLAREDQFRGRGWRGRKLKGVVGEGGQSVMGEEILEELEEPFSRIGAKPESSAADLPFISSRGEYPLLQAAWR